jgi:predicted permease
VLAFALGFTVLTALGFGILPSLSSGGRTALAALRVRAGGGRQRRRAVLVAVEVAASVALLASSGLLVRAMLRVQAVDPGFRADGAVSVRTVLPKLKYASSPARQRFYDEVLTAVRALPGVQAAGYTSGLPTVMTGGIASVTLPGEEVRADGVYSVSRRYITPGLLAALGVPLTQGRDFNDADVNDSARVGVISQALANRHWPSGDPLGRTFLFRGEEWSVIGVVGDMKVRGLERESEPQLYLPSTTVPEGPLDFYDPKDLVIRAGDAVDDLLPAVRRIVREVDPDQPISDVITLNDLLAGQTAPRRAQVQVLMALAVLALLLSGIGIHGLLAYTVAERKQEIGVRLALGAKPEAIASAIARAGAITVFLGMIPGLVLAYVAGRYMSSMLFGVPVGDVPTVAVTVALCAVAAVSGALLPALRAVRMSPMTVMRGE